MTLLDAQVYDSTRARRRKIWFAVIIIVVLLAVWVVYHLRDHRERHFELR